MMQILQSKSPVRCAASRVTRQTRVARLAALAALLGGATLIAACQRVSEPAVTLTQDQWQRIESQILAEEPDIQHRVGASFAGVVELVGYDLDPGERVEAGTEMTITWYWRALTAPQERLEFFVHLDSGAPHRQNLDHEAISGLYPTTNWDQGQLIRDRQTFTLAPEHAGHTVGIYLGAWRKWGDESRLDISDAGQGRLQDDGRLMVGELRAFREPPSQEVRRTARPLTIDGRLSEPEWQRAGRSIRLVDPATGERIDQRTQSRLVWGDDALYVAIESDDRDPQGTLTERDAPVWTEDSVILMLDAGGDGREYLEIVVNPMGTVADAVYASVSGRDPASAALRTVEGLEVAVTTETDRRPRWSAEVRIPWSAFPDFHGEPSAGVTLRGNLARIDRTEGAPSLAAWAPVFRPVPLQEPARALVDYLHASETFGRFELVAQVARTPGGRDQDGDEGDDGAEDGAGEGADESGEGTGEGARNRRGLRTVEGTPLRVDRPALVPGAIQPATPTLQLNPGR